MSAPTLVIVNPCSNLGATGKQLEALRRELDRALLADRYAFAVTEGPLHAIELARNGIAAGATRVIACGGDGTISEVVEGMMTSAQPTAAALSIVPRGTGSDFMRSLRAHSASERVSRLSQPGVRELWVDVGRVQFQSPEGELRTRHVLNVASVGLSAEAVRWVHAQGRSGKRHRFSYLMSAFVGLSRYRVSEVAVHVDSALLYRGPLQTAAVANGRFFGGGMPVAPDASIDDGLLDVVCIAPPKAWQVLPFYAAFLRAKHLTHPLTRTARGHSVSLTSASEVWIEIDGEPAGVLPMQVEALPAALRVRPL